MRLTMTHAVVATLATTFLLLAADKSGALRREVYVPPAPKVAAAPAAMDASPSPGGGPDGSRSSLLPA